MPALWPKPLQLRAHQYRASNAGPGASHICAGLSCVVAYDDITVRDVRLICARRPICQRPASAAIATHASAARIFASSAAAFHTPLTVNRCSRGGPARAAATPPPSTKPQTAGKAAVKQAASLGTQGAPAPESAPRSKRPKGVKPPPAKKPSKTGSKAPDSKHLTPDSKTPSERKPRTGPTPAAGKAAAPEAPAATDPHPSASSRPRPPSASSHTAPAPARAPAPAPPTTTAAAGTAPKQPPPVPLDERLAALPPDELLPILRAQRYTLTPGRKRTGGAAAAAAAAVAFRAQDKGAVAAATGAADAGAVAEAASAAADAADGEVQNGITINVDRQQVLLTCRTVSGRQLFTGPYRAEHVVGLVEVLASHCRGLEGAVAVAGSLAEVALRCSSQARALEFLSGRMKDEMARELPALLPRLLLALATLGYEGQEAWATATRLAHSHLRNYTGDQVALVVRAAAKVDAAAAAAPASPAGALTPAAATPTSAAADPGGSRSLGVQMLDHPAMRQRLQDLARDGGITGDGAAAVLLGLCIIGAGNTLETLGPLLRRALQEQRELSPQGWVQLLQAVGRSANPAGPTEVVALLQRYQTGLLAVLADGVAAQAAAGRLRPVELTDAAHAFARLRYLQEDFMKALATSVTRGIRSSSVELRDITTALYATALFCNRTAAAAGLFAAAAAALRPRLRTLSMFKLGLLAWSYAVADGCKLLPRPPAPQQQQQQPPVGGGGGAGPGGEVQAFLKDLASELLSRGSGLATAAEARELVRHSIRIWCTLKDPRMPSPKQLLPLLAASKGAGRGESAQPGRDNPGPQGGGSRLRVPGHPAASRPDGGTRGGGGDELLVTRPSPTSTGLSSSPSSGVSSPRGADNTGGSSSNNNSSGSSSGSGVNLPSRVSVSELQKLVFRELKELGLRPRMEEKVGMWSVDICVRPEQGKGAALAVEVDGPSHFTTSQPPRRLGTTVARDACLRNLGLQVLPLDYRLYDKVPPAGRRAILRKLLERTASSAGRDQQQQQQAEGSHGG